MTMEQVVNRNLLRYVVQQAIFCPACQQVLDVRRAVMFTVSKDGREGATRVACGSCYDAHAERLATAASATGIELEVVDGRKGKA